MVRDVGHAEAAILEQVRRSDQACRREVAFRRREPGAEEPAHQRAGQDSETSRQPPHRAHVARAEKDRLEEPPAVVRGSLEIPSELAERMSLLYELNSPEFFDKNLFKNFIDLLRARNVLGVNAEGRLTYTDMLPAVADDAQLVLHEQIRNSVLQVTHR